MIVAIIQARMGSTRLPGKVLKKVLGKPMLMYMIERLRFSNQIENVVIATSTSEKDDEIADFCINNDISYYRGNESDVLDRVYKTAKKFNADPVLRLTGDCPLIDPEIVDNLILQFTESGKYDYMNTGSSYAEGLDVEILDFSVLEEAWRNAKLKTEREHVTPYIWSNPEKFKVKTIEYKNDLSKYRFTIDEVKDFMVVKEIFKALYNKNSIFHIDEIIEFLDSHPDIFQINQDVIRNEGLLQSVEEEKEAKRIFDKYKKMRKN